MLFAELINPAVQIEAILLRLITENARMVGVVCGGYFALLILKAGVSWAERIDAQRQFSHDQGLRDSGFKRVGKKQAAFRDDLYIDGWGNAWELSARERRRRARAEPVADEYEGGYRRRYYDEDISDDVFYESLPEYDDEADWYFDHEHDYDEP